MNTHLQQQTMSSDQYHTCLPGIKAKLKSFPDKDTPLGDVRCGISNSQDTLEELTNLVLNAEFSKH